MEAMSHTPLEEPAHGLTVSAEELVRFASAILNGAGVPEASARLAAEIIVEANLRGVDTHGVWYLDVYARRLRKGLINCTPNLAFETRGASFGILDADHGLGQLAAFQAMEHAVVMARKTGIAAVSVRNSNHFGAAAYYAMWAARRNCLGLVWSTSETYVVPYGGKERFFGTNPMAISAPPGKRFPGFTLDMATSEVAYGKIIAAGKAGTKIPPGWAVDQDGQPVTDPSNVDSILAHYSALPMSGPKGYGLATMIEWMCSLMTGLPWGPHIVRKFEDWENRAPIGHYVQAIDVEAFMPIESYRERVDQFCAELKAVPPAPGFSEVMLPGEPELRTAERRAQAGCPLPADQVLLLKHLAEDLKVPFLQPIIA
jgi:ureidoglycolate dehydrogenase (NAD+)